MTAVALLPGTELPNKYWFRGRREPLTCGDTDAGTVTAWWLVRPWQAVNLVAYLRVSSESQVDGFGLDVQAEAVERWAAEHGHTLVAVFREEGLSGTKGIDDRPALAAALAATEDAAEGLVVHKLDRLARTLTVQEAVLSHVWRRKGRVFTVDNGGEEVMADDPDDPARTFVRKLMGLVSELERNTIAARLRAGRRLKVARGGYGGGAPAYGRAAVDRELAPDREEQATIARMVELRGEGRSLRYIAATLALEGHKPKRGDRWHPAVVGKILRRLEPGAA